VKLTTEDGTVVLDPSSSGLQETLSRLGLPGNGYAVLESAESHYIQVTGSRADGYVAEYREGSEQTHHSSAVSNLTHQQMIDLLDSYRSGGSWKSSIDWRRGFARGPARARASRGHKAVVMLFACIGVVSIASSGYLGFTTRQFLQHAVEVPGKVVRLARSGNTYAPVVDYVDLAGHPRTLFSTSGSRPPSFFEGESVTVLYDPEDPAFPLGAKIKTFLQLWGATLFALIFGTAFSGIALLHWMFVFRKRRDTA